MERFRSRFIRAASWNAALALALLAAVGRARGGEAPSAPGVTLERVEALVQSREFERAAAMLQELLSADPANRRASELLAFTLESVGDLEREREVRSRLAAGFPDDPRIQADYGRVLERSGDDTGALRAYRRARELSASGSTAELDAAIERMRGRTAPEVVVPLAVMSDPAASASRVQAGAAVPLGSGRHVALLGTRYDAKARSSGEASASAALALSFVRHGARASWTAGPRLHVVSPRGRRTDVGVGGAIAGRAAFGPGLEAEVRAGVETPWDEAPITILRGGRSTSAEGHLYSVWFSRRLLLQAGARRRRLSILNPEPRATLRPGARQSLWVAGADLVLWRKPGGALRGEMLDEALVATTTLPSALTLAYRHYDESTRTAPGFAALIGLVPRASVDEASIAATLASPRGHLGLDLRVGLAHDSARGARMWRAGGAVFWAPQSALRFALGFEQASEVATWLVGVSRTGWLSFHVDL